MNERTPSVRMTSPKGRGRDTAAYLLLMILGLLAVFHILVMTAVLPASMVWGGRAGESPEQLILLEAAGIILIVAFAGIVLLSRKHRGGGRAGVMARAGLWVMTGYFALNTAGNLVSMSGVERAVFTPVSLLLALLSLRLALKF